MFGAFENKRNKFSERGFTLVELSFVVMVSSIMIVMLANGYVRYLKQARIDTTHERMEILKEAFELYLLARSQLPCPAFRDVSIDHEDFGKSFQNKCYDPDNIKLSTTAQLQIGAPANAIDPSDPRSCHRGVCWLPGAGDVGPAYDEDKSIVVGAVPIRELREKGVSFGGYKSNEIAIDGYGNQFSYVMSIATNSRTHQSRSGVIGVLDEFGNPTASISNDGDFAIISHGPDGRGSFNRSGGQAGGCHTQTMDGNNCDVADGILRMALGATLVTDFVTTPGENSNPNYYDDTVYVYKEPLDQLWQNVQSDANLPAQFAPKIAGGPIGIKNSPGTGDPVFDSDLRLHVHGDSRVDGTLRVDEICSADGTYCFEVDVITGADKIKCGAGELMRGIVEGEAICVEAPDFIQPVSVQCPANYWMVDINPLGGIICQEDVEEGETGNTVVVGP